MESINVQINNGEITTTCEVKENLSEEEEKKLKEFMDEFSAILVGELEQNNKEDAEKQKDSKDKYRNKQVQGSLLEAMKNRGTDHA